MGIVNRICDVVLTFSFFVFFFSIIGGFEEEGFNLAFHMVGLVICGLVAVSPYINLAWIGIVLLSIAKVQMDT